MKWLNCQLYIHVASQLMHTVKLLIYIATRCIHWFYLFFYVYVMTVNNFKLIKNWIKLERKWLGSPLSLSLLDLRIDTWALNTSSVISLILTNVGNLGLINHVLSLISTISWISTVHVLSNSMLSNRDTLFNALGYITGTDLVTREKE